MTGRRARALRLPLALVATLVVSACVGIPSSGPVTKVADDGGFGESTVRYSPARPAAGASPEQVVRGYLDAMLAFPASSRTARTFLTPAAAKRWTPSSGVRIYTSPEVVGPGTSLGGLNEQRNDLAEPVAARVGFTEEARLDRQGRYTRGAGTSRVTYALERVDGEWRISNPQEGLLINRKFFADYYRPFNLYFFDRPGRRLLPDPVHLVVGEQLATSLLTGLAAGVEPDAEAAARTYVPPLRDLRPSVPVSERGVADVEFTADLGVLDRSARDHLSAQIVWTLRQVPQIEELQVVGGDAPLVGGDDGLQSVASWSRYAPSTSRGHGYAVSGGRVVQIDGARVRSLSGAWGRDAQGATEVAVADGGVAAVLLGGDALRVTGRQGARQRTVEGSDFVAPWWDADGTLWAVDRVAGGTRVRVVTGSTVRSIAAGPLARRDVDSFAVSPDGTRYVVTTSGDGSGPVRVGLVLRDGKDRIVGLGPPRAVHTSAERPRSASWTSSTEVTFLAGTGSGVQVHHVTIDGAATTEGVARSGTRLPDVDAQVLAVGGGDDPDLYVTDVRGRLWVTGPGTSWRLVETPARVTGLSHGR